MMVNAHVAVIDRSDPTCPLHIATFPIDNGVLWHYFNSDDKAAVSNISKAARIFFGIHPKAPVTMHIYADFVVDPLTGVAMEGDEKFGFPEFMKAVQASQAALIAKGGVA